LHNMNIQDKGLRSIAMAQISPDGLQETSAFRHQFLVCVWKQLQKICSTTTVEKGGAWQHSRTVDLRSDDSYLKSVALLKQMYDEESISICMSKFETSKNHVIMVSLLGFHCLETLNGPTISCIGSLVCFHQFGHYIISHLAVSDSSFAEGIFGKNSDGEQFRRRGIGKVLVGICQFYIPRYSGGRYREIHVRPYIKSDEKKQIEQGNLFLQLGFTPHIEGNSYFDVLGTHVHDVNRLRDCYRHSNMINFGPDLQIDKPVNRYAVFGYMEGCLSITSVSTDVQKSLTSFYPTSKHLGNINKAVYNNEESEVLNIEDIPVAIGGSSKERDQSLQKEKETGHGCNQLQALFLFKLVLFLLPKMAGNGVVAAAKYGIAPDKDGAVAAAKDVWQRRCGSCKKCNAAAKEGFVAAAKDGWLWHC